MFLFSFLSSTKGGIPPVSFAFDFFHLIISSGSHSISILEIFLVLFFNYMALTEVTTFLKLFCKCKRRFGVHSMSILCERINDEKLLFFFLAVLCLRFCVRAFSSCGKWGPLFITVCGPLTIAAPPVAEHRLQTRRLSRCGSRAQLLCGMWDLPRPGSNPCPLHWQADSQPLHYQGSPEKLFLNRVLAYCFLRATVVWDHVLTLPLIFLKQLSLSSCLLVTLHAILSPTNKWWLFQGLGTFLNMCCHQKLSLKSVTSVCTLHKKGSVRMKSSSILLAKSRQHTRGNMSTQSKCQIVLIFQKAP